MTTSTNDSATAGGAEAPAPTAAVCAERAEGNSLLAAGLGVGVIGAASGALLGAVCPLCIVAAPALIGAGVYKHIGASRRSRRARRGTSGKKPSDTG
jgi:hypothetical protein